MSLMDKLKGTEDEYELALFQTDTLEPMFRLSLAKTHGWASCFVEITGKGEFNGTVFALGDLTCPTGNYRNIDIQCELVIVPENLVQYQSDLMNEKSKIAKKLRRIINKLVVAMMHEILSSEDTGETNVDATTDAGSKDQEEGQTGTTDETQPKSNIILL